MVGRDAPTVDILLATYNGARFLRLQLESILAQSYHAWRILARDDGSTDETPRILCDYARRLGESRFLVIRDERGRLGPAGNFGHLLERSNAPYVAFADQDDEWRPFKLEYMLRRIRELEARWGTSTPLLVHSDLEVIDEGGRRLARSFWRYQGLSPCISRKWQRCLIQNVVTGCASMINAALRQMAVPIPSDAIMHDWWLALIAARLGQIGQIEEATVRYRQHGLNDTGAKRWSLGYVVGAALRCMTSDWPRERVERTQRQARAFLERYGDKLTEYERRMLESYSNLSQRGFFERRAFLLKHGILKIGVLRNLGLMLRI